MSKRVLHHGSAAARVAARGIAPKTRTLKSHSSKTCLSGIESQRPHCFHRQRQLRSATGATSTVAPSWWTSVPSSDTRKDKVLIAVQNASSLLHLQVIVSQYESLFHVHHWLTAIQRLPDLIRADGEFESFTQIQRLLLSFETCTFSALGSFSGQQLVNIITTCAQLSYTPSSRWLNFAVASLLPRLPEVVAAPESLCQLIAALAKLGYSDCVVWQQMHNASLTAVPHFTSKQITFLAAALATINCDNSTLIFALSDNVAADLSHLTVHEITELAGAFANLGAASPDFWQAIGNEAASRVTELTPKEVAEIVKAFAVAGQCHQLLLDSIGQAVLADLQQSSWSTYETWRSYGVKELGDVLWAFTNLRVHNVPLLTAIVRYVGAKTASISPGLVSNQELKRWVTFVRKQHSDFFMYGFFLSLATGVVVDHMVGATLSFMAAWWLLIRPWITDAAANAYVQFLTRQRPGGGIWGGFLFNVEDVLRATPLRQ